MAKTDQFSVLFLNQAFYPDVASTAQHLADLAIALVERGHSVTALASARCYDKPEQTYPRREIWKGIDIRRIGATGFGKTTRWRRAVDFGTYLVNCAWNLLRIPKHDVVVALTTPPLISFIGALLVRLKGGKLVFWVMDLNPDEAVAAGWLNPDSKIAWVLQKMLRYSLHHADNVIALDRFMADRLIEKDTPEERISILAPWSHDESVYFDHEGRSRFRSENNLEGKFVVMYSGNHSPCHPLSTLLLAASELRFDPSIHFAFVGGGSEFKKVERYVADHGLTNVLTLPYQPLEQLSASLSSADMHCVVMGDPFVGMVHPCKIYNIMTIGTPVLYIGPEESHIGDMAPEHGMPTWLYGSRHDDVAQVVSSILLAQKRGKLQIPEEKQLAKKFSQKSLLSPHVEAIERAGRAAKAVSRNRNDKPDSANSRREELAPEPELVAQEETEASAMHGG